MLKEVASYEKEVTKNEERVQKLRDEGKDSFGSSSVNPSMSYYH
jgi:hypothetical protein